jgi:hypothetical protein
VRQIAWIIRARAPARHFAGESRRRPNNGRAAACLLCQDFAAATAATGGTTDIRLRENPSSAGKGWGPFSSRQLTTIVCVAIVAAVMIPTAAMAAIGTFTSTTVTPAVTGTNSATVANAKGVQGSASATSAGVTRYGVTGNAGGTFGIGVQGTGTKYGVFSNGPLGVAAGKSLTCTGCVTATDLAGNAAPGRLLYQSDATFNGPYTSGGTVASFTVPAGLMCVTPQASAFATAAPAQIGVAFLTSSPAPSVTTLLAVADTNHHALVSEGSTCAQVVAGTYTYTGNAFTVASTSDNTDHGGLGVQVFSQ